MSWYNFISLAISNNIINNNLFKYWLKINNNKKKSFIENYKNQNQYDKNKLIFKNKYRKICKISYNKKFSIIKIKESIIKDYFKFNLFLNKITIYDFKEILNKFENNQLAYNRIIVNLGYGNGVNSNDKTLFRIHQYISNENSEIISNLFKILELNFDSWLENGYTPDSEEEDDDHDSDKGNKKCTELYFNNLSIDGYEDEVEESGDSDNMKSELNQMINSLITSKSLKYLNISSVNLIDLPIFYYEEGKGNHEISVNNINKTIESYSNSFQPLFSELNTSIERIEFDSRGLLNMNTFPNLLNNKSIKYLYLYDKSDSIIYLPKPIGDNSRSDGYGSRLHEGPISINQYLFENIFSSPLTSIRHYKINIKELNQLKFIFNLILNNIFKLQLYSLIFELDECGLVGEFVLEFIKEFKNLINNISTQQQQQQPKQQEQQEQQKLNNINLKEFKIKIKVFKKNDDKYFQELNNINNPYSQQ
ncbi:hypothetical protein ACTFIW_011083 [Dictyostelium discoideum]